MPLLPSMNNRVTRVHDDGAPNQQLPRKRPGTGRRPPPPPPLKTGSLAAAAARSLSLRDSGCPTQRRNFKSSQPAARDPLRPLPGPARRWPGPARGWATITVTVGVQLDMAERPERLGTQVRVSDISPRLRHWAGRPGGPGHRAGAAGAGAESLARSPWQSLCSRQGRPAGASGPAPPVGIAGAGTAGDSARSRGPARQTLSLESGPGPGSLRTD